MAGKRNKPEEIVLKLRQVEILQAQGKSIADAVRQIYVTQQTYYRWRREYAGISRDQLKLLKELETKNTAEHSQITEPLCSELKMGNASLGTFYGNLEII